MHILGRSTASGLLLFSLLWMRAAPAAQTAPPRREASDLSTISGAFQELAKKANPSVVKVLAVGYRPVDEEDESDGLSVRQQSSGSGVIVEPEGYIITNSHVVLGAERVQVLLSPQSGKDSSEHHSILRPRGRVVAAQIVGVDVETDLAVLKVPMKGLPALELGDSESVQQGQLVLALGSPLGLENSVSMGVVSSTARQLRPEDPMIYIQTDAPINPGNSGGPLVDTEGRVIGINTLLYSQSGGNEGIGFAAPSNIVKAVFDQIRLHGRVRRAEIGVETQTITPMLAAGWKLAANSGVVISDVTDEGPAEQAGLRVGDIILKLNGKRMENSRQFAVNLYRPKEHDVAQIEILRGSQRMTVPVPVVEKQSDPERFASLLTRGENLIAPLGVLAVELTPKMLEMMTPLRKETGVLVAARAANAPFMEGTFKAGDVIYAINREAVATIADIRAVLSRIKSGEPVAVQIERSGRLMFVSLEMP